MEHGKKKWRNSPSLTVWIGFSLYAAFGNMDIFWLALLISIITIFPIVPLYQCGHYLLEKFSGFFLTFLEKPLLWCGIALVYLLGFLLLKDHFLLSLYWSWLCIPFMISFLCSFRYFKFRWKALALVFAFFFLYISQSVSALHMAISLFIGLLYNSVLNDIFQ